MEETASVYRLGTLDGRLFIPFVICCMYLLLSPAEEDKRAREYFVYPSLVLCLFIFNPVFIHYMIKFMLDPERVVRIFWPLPIGGGIVYCGIPAVYALRGRWKRAVLLAAAVLTLLLVSDGNHAGISFSRADNPEKLIKGAKEVCDTIYNLAGEREKRVLVPKNLFFWIRGYDPFILTPYQHKAEFMYDDNGAFDSETTGEKALEAECEFIVVPGVAPEYCTLGDYGYTLAAAVPGEDCIYYIYWNDTPVQSPVQ